MTKKKLDATTRRMLIADGKLTADYLTRTPKARTCPTCHARCVAGIPEWGAGHGAGVWLRWEPVNAVGEFLALAAGMQTWWLFCSDQFHPRNAYTISKYSADTETVFVDHQCLGPPLPINDALTKPWPKESRTAFSGPPPF